eukprot:2119359-Rhodomonas_salina.3
MRLAVLFPSLKGSGDYQERVCSPADIANGACTEIKVESQGVKTLASGLFDGELCAVRQVCAMPHSDAANGIAR